MGGGGNKPLNSTPIAVRELIIYDGDTSDSIGTSLAERASIKSGPNSGDLNIVSTGNLNIIGNYGKILINGLASSIDIIDGSIKNNAPTSIYLNTPTIYSNASLINLEASNTNFSASNINISVEANLRLGTTPMSYSDSYIEIAQNNIYAYANYQGRSASWALSRFSFNVQAGNINISTLTNGASALYLMGSPVQINSLNRIILQADTSIDFYHTTQNGNFYNTLPESNGALLTSYSAPVYGSVSNFLYSSMINAGEGGKIYLGSLPTTVDISSAGTISYALKVNGVQVGTLLCLGTGSPLTLSGADLIVNGTNIRYSTPTIYAHDNGIYRRQIDGTGATTYLLVKSGTNEPIDYMMIQGGGSPGWTTILKFATQKITGHKSIDIKSLYDMIKSYHPD